MNNKTDKLLTFQEAISQAGNLKHVLLGNGFSISLKPDIFSYSSLFEECQKQGCISVGAMNVFKKFETKDFEIVIKALNDTYRVLGSYKDKGKLLLQLKKDAKAIKKALVELLSLKHPSNPSKINDSQYNSCIEFLSNFERIYTLNYDLLLYWVIMKALETGKKRYDDGFRHENNEEYVTWCPEEAEGQNIYYLHGALHLYDIGPEIKKFTWKRTGITLMKQVKSELDNDNFPLFVAEGTSEEKMTKINHSQYLGKNIRSFAKIGGSLFVFGHALASNDDHYLSLIAKNKIEKLFVSLYDDGTTKNKENNNKIRKKADLLVTQRLNENPKRPLEVLFYDAVTAKVWG